MESNQRRDNDYDYSSHDDPDDLDREHAESDGRDKGRNAADDMNRRGMMIDSDIRHQAGTDLHDGSEFDQQGGAAYESRVGSGDDLQEGARGSGSRMEGSEFDREESSRYDASVNAGEDDLNRRGAMMNADLNRQASAGAYETSGLGEDAQQVRGTRMRADDMQGDDTQGDRRMGGRTPMANSREPMDADRNASDNVSYTGDDDSEMLPGQYQSSTPGYGLTRDSESRGSGTGETDARYMHQTSNENSPNNVGDEGFSDTMTPPTGGPGKGRIRTDWQGDYSLADTEETQSDHFREELDEQDEAGANTGARTQAEHFQEERNARDKGDYRSVTQANAGVGNRTPKREGGYLGMTSTSNTGSMGHSRTVAAIFRDWNDATRAVGKLQDAGFDDDYIGIARLDSEKGNVQQHQVSGEKKDDGERVAGGVAAGAAVGGVAGLLAALASLAIPGVGPIVAGGVLATTFGSAAGAAITGAGVGAGIGAATGGLIGALTSLGLSEDEARAYESDMRRGGTLVTVQAGDRADEAIRMLQQMGGETHGRMGGQSGSGNSSDPNWRFG
jgi:hypothetical protein